MDWEDMRLALVLSRRGTLSGAARVLGVSHTTVARRLQRLEASLATRLFDKRPDGFVPTDLGRVLLETAQRMEANADALARRVRGQDRSLEGPLRVSMPGLLLQPWLLRHLEGFAEAYPEIDLHLVSSAEIMSLARREMDVTVRLTRAPPDYAFGSKVRRLTSAVYGSRVYLEAHPDPASWTWIGFEPAAEDVDQETLDRWFPGIRVAWRFNDGGLIFDGLVRGLGIGRTLSVMAERDERLVRIAHVPETATLDLWLLSHEDLRGSARVRTFMDFMRAAIVEDLDACA
jgi:DNA-binding transcriptional LysR family regulator